MSHTRLMASLRLRNGSFFANQPAKWAARDVVAEPPSSNVPGRGIQKDASKTRVSVSGSYSSSRVTKVKQTGAARGQRKGRPKEKRPDWEKWDRKVPPHVLPGGTMCTTVNVRRRSAALRRRTRYGAAELSWLPLSGTAHFLTVRAFFDRAGRARKGTTGLATRR